MNRFAPRDHISVYWQNYLSAFVVLSLLGLCFYLFQTKTARFSEISGWPSTTATITRAKVNQFSAASETGIGWHVSADLSLYYQISGKSFSTRYTRTWTPTIVQNFPELLKEGNLISIRYFPKDPSKISLYPIVQE